MNKKAILFFAVMSSILTSCNSEQSVETAPVMAPVTVRVSDFSVMEDDFSATRAATPVLGYEGVKILTLAFYDGTTEVYKATQLRDDNTTYTTFGEFSCSLPLGSYTMLVLGYGGTTPLTLTSATAAVYDGIRVRDTFSATQAVSVTNTDALELSATLNRLVAGLAVVSTDNRPATVTQIRTTVSAGSNAFNPSTGIATANAGLVNTVAVSGSGPVNPITYLFLTADEQTVSVTVDALNANNEIITTHTINNVPLKRNRRTRLTGALFSAPAASNSFTVNGDWLTDYDFDF